MTKFIYGDKIEVIHGFYKGKTGIVVSELEMFLTIREYMVDFDSNIITEWIKEKDLKKVK